MSRYLSVDTVEHKPFCAAPAVQMMRYRSGVRAVCKDCGAWSRMSDEQAGPASCVECGNPTSSPRFAWCSPCAAERRRAREERAAAITAPAMASPAPKPPPRGRYILACVRCGITIHLHRPEPRIPLCERCKRYGKPKHDQPNPKKEQR